MPTSVELHAMETTQEQSLIYARELNALYQQERAQRRALEVAQRRLAEEFASREAFVALISHELRTPLVAAWAFLEILMQELRDRLEPDHRELLDITHLKTGELVRVVRELTEFINLDDNRQWPVRRDGLDLADLVAGVIAEFTPLAAEKQISLTSDIAPGQPVMIGWQEVHLILYHLVSNAVKFTPPGGRVSVSGAFKGAELVLEVTDTGIGIPSDVQHTIFRPFYQVEHYLTRSHAGLGLGLALVERAVRVLGGSVAVRSTLGQGSTFTVCLPYQAAGSLQETIERLSTELDRLQAQSLRIAQDFRQLYRSQQLTPTGARAAPGKPGKGQG